MHARQRVRQRHTVAGARTERGSSLIIALVVTLVMGLVVSTLLVAAQNNRMSTQAYTKIRTDRYAGDAALKAAVNWAKDEPDTAKDPDLGGTQKQCRYTYTDDTLGPITASCGANPGSNSGATDDTGLVPTNAMTLLGDRQSQPGIYNQAVCKGWWSSFLDNFVVGSDPSRGSPEYSFASGAQQYDGWASCSTRTRPWGQFLVNGNIVSAGRIKDDQNLLAVPTGSSIKATYGCAPRTCAAPTATEASDPGRSATDPGNWGHYGNPTPTNTAYQAVGFEPDGRATNASALTVRDDAPPYYYDAASGALTPIPTADCAGSARTVVFLPGVYKKAETLNKWTANVNCSDVTFWMAPDPGADGKLLTKDDKTGAYLLDFRAGAKSQCHAAPGSGNAAQPSVNTRWCIGGSNSQSPRVVVGTPLGWTPLGSSGTTTQRVKVTLGQANAIDDDRSQTWSNSGGAMTIDDAPGVAPARYQATFCITIPIINYLIGCKSQDRSIKLRNFSPIGQAGQKVTGPPIDEVGYPYGKIKVRLKYGITNTAYLGQKPKVKIETVTARLGRQDCGTYEVPYNDVTSSPADTVQEYTFTDAQAYDLAARCHAVDQINAFELTLYTYGHDWNKPMVKIALDGAEFSYESFKGAQFPYPPTGSTGKAQSDCDPKKAGAQLIFSGEAHVYVADGSLEVCAGPYPKNVDDHQQIGIWQGPAVAPIRAASSSDVTAVSGGNASVSNLANARVIGEPSSASGGRPPAASLSYGGCFLCGKGDTPQTIKWVMPKYQVPSSDYRIKKINARMSYTGSRWGFGSGTPGWIKDILNGLICQVPWLWGCSVGAPNLTTPGGNINLPNNRGDRPPVQYQKTLYDSAGGTNFLTPSDLTSDDANRRSISFTAHGACILGSCLSWTQEVEGLELDVTLEPVDANAKIITPPGGCITEYPNYGTGDDAPDCAVLRADSRGPADQSGLTGEDRWRSQVSVKGTVYAPAGAVELDNDDVAYPLANRGIILRHLRISGYGNRANYFDPAVDITVNRDQSPRDAIFTACVQSTTRRNAARKCGEYIAGDDTSDRDRVLTRAGVRFEATPGTKPPVNNVPKILWWSTDR